MQFHNILKAGQAIFSHKTSRKSSIEASNGESSPNYLRCVPDIVAPNEKSMFDKRFSWTFTLDCRCLGFIVNFSSGGSGKIDYTPISLLPDDAEYVRYTEESHIVSCIGEDERYLKWLRPDGAEVDVKGRVHVEAFDGQLRLIIHSIKKEDQGVWMCCRENDENDGQSFELKVYGEREKKFGVRDAHLLTSHRFFQFRYPLNLSRASLRSRKIKILQFRVTSTAIQSRQLSGTTTESVFKKSF